ncbi:beta-N-acetylhexosaminidase [Cohnella sp. AR92]|uniref:beta-N-acetylhexosaminidase n=1 Tax=Cohnella sp. AR92 TaxID=648716 RepID=UPI000F8D0AA4|nr:beta-N-acetylhexosaminidase [Cohnella sp. AR92]RUS48397.1 beta-N-acetylhexosaminidase [Cohnella sp. AR92]
MKNLTNIRFRWPLLALGVLLLIAGCGNNGGALPSTDTSSPSNASPSPSPSTSPIASTAPSASPSASPGGSVPSVSPAPPASPPDVDDPVERQLKRMTLEEKIGQMIFAGVDGTTLGKDDRATIADAKVGGIILYSRNVSDVKGTVSLLNAIKQANKANPVPLFLGVDQEGGKVSRLPSAYEKIPANQEVGAAKDEGLAGEMGSLLARELLSAGFNLDFAPVLDVNSNPNNPVIGPRSFGSSAKLVSQLGIAEMEGLRGGGVIPVAKHFPGHGDTSVDSHLDLPVVNKTAEQLAKLEWIPFKQAIENRVEAIMVAHILYPKLDPDKPASLSKELVGHQLRQVLGYDGVVMTDDITMGAIVKHYTLPAAAVDAILAGDDIVLVAHGHDNMKTVRDSLLAAVKDGRLDEKRIDESVVRILRLKNDYALRDKNTSVPNLTKLNQDIKAWRSSLTD